jgi:hypothetical protein
MGSGDSSRDKKKEEKESGGGKLTEEERRQLDRARKYVEKAEKKIRRSDKKQRSDSSPDDYDRRHNSSSRRKGRKEKKSRDKYSSSDDEDNNSDVNSRRERKRHRSSSHRDRKKHHHRRSSKDVHHEKSLKKRPKHRHRDNDKETHHIHNSKRHKSNKNHDVSFRLKASKRSITSNLISLGEIVAIPPQELLETDTNYFSHNTHLRLYLFRHYGIYFEDLTSDESHDAFREFVSMYNSGKLELAYYDSKGKLPQEALDQCHRTQHKWNFKTNKVEQESLKIVRDGVKKQTEYDAGNTNDKGIMQQAQATWTSAAAVEKHADQSGEHSSRSSTDERRRSDKRHRERVKVANEEMYGVGKADHGWERKIETRREQSNKIHGAARDRDCEAGAELDDNAIYGGNGGGDISYEAALAKEKKYRERKEVAKNERTSELLKKEEEKQKKMLEMLGISGLKPGEKIKIPPRQP